MQIHHRRRRAVQRLSRPLAVATAALLPLIVASPARAQELVHQFINPSFGGNPFYSDHLLAIAGLDRPAEPEEPTVTPSPEELLAEQIRSQLTSQASTTILSAIRNAQPGQSGQFALGEQTIAFTRTTTETRVTFTNTRTGESRVVVVPVTAAPLGTAAFSAERALGAMGTSLAPVRASGAESSLLAAPPPL